MIVNGHRGARFEAPENTVAGFRHAAGLGLRAVEFDVRMTADEQLVVIHDATVDRTTDGTGQVCELPFAALAELDAAAGHPDWTERCPVPRLEEVLDLLEAFEQAEIEVKADGAGRTAQVVDGLVAAIDRRGLRDRIVLTSFHADALAEAGRLAPGLRRGYIGDWDDPAVLDRALALGVTRACVQHTTSSAGLVSAARAAGLEVIGWPCNDEAAWRTCLDWELDGVTTDRPGWLLRELLPD
ncbi:glycerophosphoryl diester phosphodiesterase [Friedmanniella endophytica]|uniref:Glycerophosphoryl diester phosphodiesterase n=1 Tax=Microlunatus kandeliicorticis TaxID=1759536 RepID=A0A7W3P7P8_9ACTN|nr:glycerophosphodiester phosphodiesterase [Microlunatus kandeliicorticis]MBA8796244.1 glycerophosphoryl diester phosphodiesterase [Microlunatus kandeliicorticis]